MQHNESQHNGTKSRVLLCLGSFMLSLIYGECRKQAHYAECRYTVCLGTRKIFSRQKLCQILDFYC
jgi:hypothetical protein